MLKFFGKDVSGSPDPEDKQFRVRIWGLREQDASAGACHAHMEFQGEVLVTLGTTAVISGAELALTGAGSAWAKTIDINIDRTLLPGMRVVGSGTENEEGLPILIFDHIGYAALIVEITGWVDPQQSQPEDFEQAFMYTTI